jgi:hypothetical protein
MMLFVIPRLTRDPLNCKAIDMVIRGLRVKPAMTRDSIVCSTFKK